MKPNLSSFSKASTNNSENFRSFNFHSLYLFHSLFLFLVSLSGLGQLDDLTTIPEDPLDCGAEHMWIVDMSGTVLESTDTDELDDLLKDAAVQQAVDAGFSCAGCDDPGYSGCIPDGDILFFQDVGYSLTDEENFVVSGEILIQLKCSLCNAGSADEVDTEEQTGGIGVADGSYHDLLQQTKCGEGNYIHVTLQGLLLDTSTEDKAWEEIKRILQDNHNSFGFGCKLCPDGTKRCKVEVSFFWAYSEENQLGYPQIEMDTIPGYYHVPTQEVWVRYKCLDCDEVTDDDPPPSDFGENSDRSIGQSDSNEASEKSGEDAQLQTTLKSDLETTECKVFPNPFLTGVTIQVPASENVRMLWLTDLRGSVVIRKQVPPDQYSIELNFSDQLSQGTYILHIMDQNGALIFQEKLAKM